jgi:hypothetical protein
MVNTPVPSLAPTSGSFSVPSPAKLPSLIHWDELELPREVGAHEDEHDAAVGAVVLQLPLGQWGAVGGGSAQGAVNGRVDELVHQGVARVGAPDVGAEGAAQAARILLMFGGEHGAAAHSEMTTPVRGSHGLVG